MTDIETPITRNFIPQILLNVQDFYFHKFGYTSYDEGIFRPWKEHMRATVVAELIKILPALIKSMQDKRSGVLPMNRA
jgi:hypothetical protein